MPYQVFIKESAQRELDDLPRKHRLQVERHIDDLGRDPFPPDAAALKGQRFKGLYRKRSGDYRIIYQVQHDRLIVLVVKIGNRRDVYQ